MLSVSRIMQFLVFFGTVVLFCALIESIMWLSSQNRLVLFGIIVVSGAAILVYCGFVPILCWLGRDRRYSFETLSGNVGRTFPDIRDKLLNAIQLFSLRKDNKEQYSEELISDAMTRTGDSFGSYDFNKSVDYCLLRRQARILGVFMSVFIAMFLFTAGTVNNAAVRVFQPTKEFAEPASFSLDVLPGDTEIIRNESVTIRVNINGNVPNSLKLYQKRESIGEYESFEMIKTGEKSFTFLIDNVKESFEYFVRGNDRSGLFLNRYIDSGVYNLKVIYRPAVRILKLHLEYPPYSQMGSMYLEDNVGNVSALNGTEVQLSVSLNKPVKSAFLKFTGAEPVPMTVNGLTAETGFTVSENSRYTIQLADEDNITNIDPIEYRVTALDDAYPFIQLAIPGEDMDLTEDKQVLLGMGISDDFGLSRLRLGYRRVGPGEDNTNPSQPGDREELLDSGTGNVEGILTLDKFTYLDIPLDNRQGLVQDIYFFWDLKNQQIFPEDRIEYFTEVYDNDRISGPKVSRTKVFTLRLPSLDELFSRAFDVQEKQEESLSEIIEDSEELHQTLKELSDDFLQTKEIEWEQQQKTEEALAKQEELQKRMGEIQKEITELVEKLEQNDLLSAETLDRYKELQELLRELALPDMQDAMNRMRESLENTSEMEQNRQSLENLREEQENYMERVKRTLNILKRLQIEQMMDEVVIKSENITEIQKTVNNQLDSLSETQIQEIRESEKDNLVRQEKDLAKNVDNLQKSLESLLEKMIDQPDFSTGKLSEILGKMDEKELSEKMMQMSKEMSQEALQKALEMGKQIEKEMEEIDDDLKQAQQEMQQEQKEEILKDVLKSAFDLLEISYRQEELKEESNSLTTNSDKFREVADRQNNMKSGLSTVIGNLTRLTEKSFFITPDIVESISKSVNSMQSSITMLEARNKNGSITNQDQSLLNLNETVNLLRNALKQIQESNDGMGYSEFMERLEQMSERQQQINQESGNMPQSGNPSLEEQMQMLRLAGDQELLRKSLEQLLQEIQDQTGMKERLGQMGEDMEEVIKDMEEINVTERTRKLQEQILSRMLDAQRSINRRDFSKYRIAESAGRYEGIDPGKLPENLGGQKRLLEEDLINALKEGYTRDFEELIRKYFEILNRKGGTTPKKNN